MASSATRITPTQIIDLRRGFLYAVVPRVGVSIITLYYPLLSSIALAERACVLVSR